MADIVNEALLKLASLYRFDCGATWLNLLATKGRAYRAESITLATAGPVAA